MKFKTTIPIKPHLKKYLAGRYQVQTPLEVSKKSLLGLLVIKSFSERQNDIKNIDSISDEIEIIFDNKTDIILCDGNVFDFNKLIDEIYRKDLGGYIGFEFTFSPYPERKQAIAKFNDKFKITEDEMPVETLIKHYQRHPEDTKFFESKWYAESFGIFYNKRKKLEI